MPISNEIFETFRIQERAREQLRAVRLLAKQGYTIVDLEGQIINKTNPKNFLEILICSLENSQKFLRSVFRNSKNFFRIFYEFPRNS